MAVYPLLAGMASRLIPFLGVFAPKIRRFNAGRKNWKKELQQKMNILGAGSQQLPVLLFHCSSVGEFEQARPIIERMHAEFPGYRILLSFFSPSGYELRKKYHAADLVCYLPLDTRKNMRDFLDLVQPAAVIIVKYEFWPNLLMECHYRSVPVISVSAIFRPDQFYFRFFGSYFLKALRTIQHFFVQDEQSREILLKAGIKQVTVAGDTRFDRVHTILEQSIPVPEASDFVTDSPAMIIGSAWPEDMKVLAPVIKRLAHRLKFIIVPHEVDDHSVEVICRYLPDHIKFSNWSGSTTSRVMVVDKMGMLSRLYANGMVAWVGGAYGKGLHNILEAAVYGLPVFFGNRNYEKFREAKELIREGAAYPIGNAQELEEKILALLDSPDQLKKLSHVASNFVGNQRGATDLVIQFLQQMLSR